jgi:putative restriction endonuclease
VKAVFDVKPNSGYDDDVTVRYHFPAKRHYLDVARNAVGDWVLYREPRRNGGRQAYVASANVLRVERDPAAIDHYYAYVADYQNFPTPVPFVVNGHYAETPLRARSSGVGQALQGNSMRTLLNEDFDAIVLTGFRQVLETADLADLDFPSPDVPSYAQSGMAESVDRRVEQILLNRKIRDAAFRLEVCRAYDNRCAVTGLRIINGGGRAEVQAAHIKPVANAGPDVVQNGLALSATVHWLFDRHLMSVSEDYRLLVSHNRVPSELQGLFRSDRLHLPQDQRDWPHPAFLSFHRELYVGAVH